MSEQLPETADMLDWRQLVPAISKARGDDRDSVRNRLGPAKPAGSKQRKPAGAAYGIRAEIIAELCQVDIATARRWKSGASRMPHAAAALVSGDLGAFSPYWKGWRIQGDAIISPDGWQIRRDDALTVPLMLGQINALRAELAKSREWGDKEEQPAPPDAMPQIRSS